MDKKQTIENINKKIDVEIDNIIINEIVLPEGNGTCSIKIIENLPLNLQVNLTTFDELWDLHPKELGIIKIFGKEIATPRYQQSFGMDYKFSGLKHKAEPIDNPYLKRILNFICKLSEKSYNMLFLNWYSDNTHYIGAHSDNESQIIEKSDIYSFSFGAERKFIIKSKRDTKEGKNKKNKFKKEIILKNNSLIIMCGEMQKYYTHEIRKQKKICGRRINITSRLFK